MTRAVRLLVLAGVLWGAAPVTAGQVDTGAGHDQSPTVAEALARAVTSPWLSSDGAKYQIRSTRDIVVDMRRRTLMVFALPAKHRKVVTMLQRILAEPAEKPSPVALAPKIPVKSSGPLSTYKYQGEKLITVIRDLASEAGLNLIIRGPEPRQPVDVMFKNVPTKDLLKLLLDVYNFNYQMSPNGETLVLFCGPTHRVMESYSVPAKVAVPLEEIAQALQSAILDVEEPYGPPVEEPGPVGVPGMAPTFSSGPSGTGPGSAGSGGTGAGDNASTESTVAPSIGTGGNSGTGDGGPATVGTGSGAATPLVPGSEPGRKPKAPGAPDAPMAPDAQPGPLVTPKPAGGK